METKRTPTLRGLKQDTPNLEHAKKNSRRAMTLPAFRSHLFFWKALFFKPKAKVAGLGALGSKSSSRRRSSLGRHEKHGSCAAGSRRSNEVGFPYTGDPSFRQRGFIRAGVLESFL